MDAWLGSFTGWMATLAEVGESSTAPLYAAITALASVIAWGGRHVITKLHDCEADRTVLHKKVGKVAASFAAHTGEVIDLDDVE